MILVNALISTVIALAVAFAVDARRPDAEELAALYTPAAPILITPTPNLGLVPTFTPVPPVSANPTATPATSAPSGTDGQDGQVYVVESGDSLGGISARFGVTLDALMAANQLDNPDFVFVGQRLTIPTGAVASAQPSGDASVAPLLPTPISPGGVIVNAISGGGDLAEEQILIVNDSDNPSNLLGWTLQLSGSGSGTPIYTFGNLPLFPGGSVRLHSAGGVDTSVDLYWGQPAARLTSGAVLTLINGQGVTVHTFPVP